ncbi:hypothetical protein D3C72_1174760 [compost metagenome]
MLGKIDASFTTEQRDLFASGIVAEIGVNAYAVWSAIKFYADYNTGHAWPGMRTVGEKLGLSAATVKRAIDVLEAASMVRVVKESTRRRGQTYIARERMAVRIGSALICTIVVDYVPSKFRGQVNRIAMALEGAETDPDAFSEVEVIPGPGFAWDAVSGRLRGQIAASQLPPPVHDDHMQRIGEAMLAKIAPNMAEKALKK